MLETVNAGIELSALVEGKAENGKTQIIKQNNNMTEVYKAVNIITIDVIELLNITNKMQSIIEIVTKIADQTNLLLLNVAIEAARAGEHGRGYAVVAQEVKKLSDLTKKSVTDVAQLRLSTIANVDNLKDSLKKIKNSVQDGNEIMKETDRNG